MGERARLRRRILLYAQNDIYSCSLSVRNTENVALVLGVLSLVIHSLAVVGKNGFRSWSNGVIYQFAGSLWTDTLVM